MNISAKSLMPIGISVTAFALAGCGAFGGTSARKGPPAMDAYQAHDRIEKLLDETFAAVRPSLKWQAGSAAYSPGDDLAGQPNGTALVSQDRYVMTKVSKGRVGGLLGILERRWKEEGYSVEVPNPTVPEFGAHTPDGFTVAINVNSGGRIVIGASSPRVKAAKESIPFPGNALPVDGNGNVSITPNVDDPFWSR